MLTVHLVLHFGFKEKLDRKFLESFLVNYEKISLLDEDYGAAMQLLPDTNTDHEDALQLAAAKRAGCTRIVTLDKDFATTYGHLMAFEVL
jgi:predicted nucleic acid-binding protein